MVDALRLGLLGEEVLCGPAGGTALVELRRRARSELGMSSDQLEDLLLETEPLLAELPRLLSLDLPSGTTHQELISRAVIQIAALPPAPSPREPRDAAAATGRSTRTAG